VDAAPIWQSTPPEERAACLERAADLMETRMPALLGLRCAGSRQVAAQRHRRSAGGGRLPPLLRAEAATKFDNDTHRPLGPVVCISPWNFPLAIFTGQVAAALAAGNPVLAKPAEQVPLIAATAVRLLHEAGIPRAVLQLLPGAGEIGAASGGR
jgi:RHH-type proline utilization regulon transcriptional repressor/proline dehydrogenase/delta 1-pyrroline-5-carboxylate dehydrogenase